MRLDQFPFVVMYLCLSQLILFATSTFFLPSFIRTVTASLPSFRCPQKRIPGWVSFFIRDRRGFWVRSDGAVRVMVPMVRSSGLNACDASALNSPSKFMSHAARSERKAFAVDVTAVRPDQTVGDLRLDDRAARTSCGKPSPMLTFLPC